MTAINGSIVFNNSTGSDTEASGVGPETALTGTGASTNNSATVDLSADSPDLSGISVGDLLWVNSATLRQFSVIASIDTGADTVTCDDIFTVIQSDITWAIGGKRSDPFSTSGRQLLSSDAKAGWTIDIEYTGTDYGIGAGGNLVTIGGTDTADGDVTNGCITIKSSSETRPTLLFNRTSTNINYFFQIVGDLWRLEHLKFDVAVGSVDIVIGIISSPGTSSGLGLQVVDCEITAQDDIGFGSAIDLSNNNTVKSAHIERNYIHGLTEGINVSLAQNADLIIITMNHIEDIGTVAIDVDDSPFCITKNIIDSPGTLGIRLRGNSRRSYIADNIIYNAGDDGIRLQEQNAEVAVMHNIIANCSGYGINTLDVATSGTIPTIDFNAYYNNTFGNVAMSSGLTSGDHSIELTEDPFESASTNDFNLNAATGGGQLLREATINLTF